MERGHRRQSGGLAILLTDPGQNRMGENAIFPFCHRSPCFRLDIQGLHIFNGSGLSKERVQIHLIDHRSNPGVQAQVGQPFGIKVAYADSPDFSGFVQSLQGTP